MMQILKEIHDNKSDDICLVTKWITEGEYAYFVPFDLNVFIKYNLKNKKKEWILPIDKVWLTQGAFSDILKYENKIILIPLHATDFVIIDLDKKNIDYITIPRPKNGINCGFFSKGIIYKKELIAISYLYPGFLKMNLENYSIDILDNWYTDLGNMLANNFHHNIVSYESCVVGNAVYMIINHDNKLMRYDFEKKEVKFFQLENRTEECYKSICYDGDFFWLTGDGKTFLKWDEAVKCTDIIELEDKTDMPDNTLYRYSVSIDKIIYFFSSIEAPIVVIDSKSNIKVDLIWADNKSKKGFKVDAYQKENEGCYIFTYKTKEVKEISLGRVQNQYIECIKDRKLMRDIIMKSDNKCIGEALYCLEELIEISTNMLLQEKFVDSDSVGKRVYYNILMN